MPRKYTKRSTFWDKKSQPSELVEAAIKPGWDEVEHFSANASCGGNSTSFRNGFAPNISPIDRFKNINSGILPYEYRSGMIGMQQIIETCQRAYASVAVVRNAVEGAVEFSASKLHIKTSNQTVKDFFTAWFNKVKISGFTTRFMREYYRSGNVFTYRFDGVLSQDQFGKMQTVFGAKKNLLPIRYVILNPAQIYLNGGLGYDNNWTKIMSTYEIERLKTPQTPEDKEVFKSLPDNVKKLILNSKGNVGTNEIYMPLKAENLSYVFYKKQDYEPLAIPMIYPVLGDIEWKLELKKMDMSLSRTVEQVILLITAGEAKDQYGGGVNQKHIDNLVQMFKNQTLGRVLVSDYTTKGEWLIPDIGGILGQEKYKQVESDIKEGLQSILMGEDKFANAQIKTKVFIERMKEAQQVFLTEFLMPEIKKICEAMSFKNVPEIEFEEVSLSDPAVMARIYAQLLQLGALDPAETFEAIKSGILPDKESNLLAQKEYHKNRDDGLYYPLVGGSQEEDPAVVAGGGRPSGVRTKPSKKTVAPIGSKASEQYSMAKLSEISIKADDYKELVIAELKKNYKGEFGNLQYTVAEKLVKNILTNENEDKWNLKTAKAYIKNPKDISAEAAIELNEIGVTYNVSDWEAVLLRKSKL